jgi:hypothetical protein
MNIKDFAQPTILKGTQYGTTITIELDHSDTSIDEVMDGMLTIVYGLGYLPSTINEWIKQKAKDIYDDEHAIVKQTLIDSDILTEEDELVWGNEEELPTECWCGSRERCDCISEPNDNDEYSDFVDSNWDEDRIDIIGQNGNEGTHYGLATDEDIDECELNELSEVSELNDKPYFDWDEGIQNADDDNEFDDYGMRIQPNDKLKAAAQRYSDEVKAKHTPIKLDKKLVKRGKIKDLKK